MSNLEHELAQFGIRPGLERMEKLMLALGNPHKKLKVILVTGTNGKGSTTSYIASILKETGYTVGSYFSPHLIDNTERIKINGIDISKNKFNEYEKMLLALHSKGQEMTLFEALTAMAYMHFVKNNCEYAIMEIGMGGTYDATNLSQEIASVITTIDFDHMQYLGKTIEEITKDKAGIIKSSKLCVTGTTGKALEIIKAKTHTLGIELSVIGETIHISNIQTYPSKTRFDYQGKNSIKGIETSLAGDYQAKNAALAIALCERIERVDESSIRKGIKNAQNQGRMQILQTKPYVVLDGAHNPEGIRVLVNNLGMYAAKKIIVVFGVMKDKDWREMIKILEPNVNEFIITMPHLERAEDPNILAKEIIKPKKIIEKSDDALRYAIQHANENDLILVCGSLYLVGEILTKIKTI